MIGGPRPVCVNANIWATTWSTRRQREGGGVYLTSSSITFPREIRIASTSNRTWNTYSPYNIIIIYNISIFSINIYIHTGNLNIEQVLLFELDSC